ncbi:MAG: hypothetical protein HY721_08495 [Planctomycetes bacterium]|nr:hypothetical protein [Planctomycetota bacterium]
MRERFKLFEQELGHKIWTIVQLFYRSRAVFQEQFESYERKVLEISRETGIHRNDLRLRSKELGGLLDFKKLERMRDGLLQELKDLCHIVFRGHDRTDVFDRYVSDIFHEISILKEEHYNVKTYAPLYERDAAEVELKHILDEAHTLFPGKLRHTKYLFERAQGRLEEHLASFRGIPLFIRSLYLHRNDFVAEAYTGGLGQFYRLMYPGGAVEGYYEAGLSFYHSGFLEEALEAFRLAEAAYRDEVRDAAKPLAAEGRRRVDGLLLPLRTKLRRLGEALARDAACAPPDELSVAPGPPAAGP